MNEVIVTPDGIRWEIYRWYAYLVENESCELVGVIEFDDGTPGVGHLNVMDDGDV